MFITITRITYVYLHFLLLIVGHFSYDDRWCLQIRRGEGVQHARDALHSHVLETQILRPWVKWGPQSMLDTKQKRSPSKS